MCTPDKATTHLFEKQATMSAFGATPGQMAGVPGLVSGYTAPTETALDAQAGTRSASDMPSFPAAATGMIPCAKAALTASASG